MFQCRVQGRKTSKVRILYLNGRCAEIKARDIRAVLHLFFLFQSIDKFING